jgi:hypothetical protein
MRRSLLWLTLILIVAVTVGITIYLLRTPSSTASSLATLLSAGVGLISLIVAVAPSGQRLWSRYRRRQLKVRIALADEAPLGKEDRKYSALDTEDRRLVRYRADRVEAEKELGPYLPANPRKAKRIINHGRLYALIGEDRGVFGGDPELTHRHLAKWVLILEHWPRLGAALTREPTKMQDIEDSQTVEKLQEIIDTIIPGTRATDDLFRFLHHGVSLSPVLDRLVRFEPPVAAEL